MKQLNKFTLPLAAFALVATGALSTYAYQSQAQTPSSDPAQIQSLSRENPMSNLVKALASKFNLNETDVQQVFDDNRASMEARHSQMAEDRLKQAVNDGKLTQDQADKITSKHRQK